MRHRFTRVLLAAGLFMLLGGTATVAARSHHAAASSYNVGIVYSRTGLLAAYGAEYVEGFKLGLQYATNGTNKVNGKTINLTYVDDKTDAATAVNAAKDLIGQGYKIIGGTDSSGVALQVAPLAAQNHVLFISGPAASDAITGINKYTFRSGRQTLQDVYTANSFLQGAGKKVVVFDQDSAFGHGNYAAVKAVVGGKGHTVTEVSVPLTATDFTPFAQQAKNANPDLVFVAWAGTTAGAMWKALDQQNVFTGTQIVTGLAERATWATLGDQATKIHFLSHYVYTAPKNKVNDWLVQQMRKQSQVPDIFTPDGFVTAQMIVHALKTAGGDDVDKMVTALEGYKFLAPKGFQAIRPQDHAMLQPMFRVQLVSKNGTPRAATPRHRHLLRHGAACRGDARVTSSTLARERNHPDPRNKEPRARHRRRNHRRRCRARRPRGRAARRDRAERRREDDAVQPPLRAPAADVRHGRARRRRHHRAAAVPPDAGGPRADVPGLERLPAALRARERPPRRRGGARRDDADLAARRVVQSRVEQAAWALDRVGLGPRGAVLAGSLAHGDKRKLELAMVLAGDPRVILLDEPMAGVSIENVPELVELIRSVHVDEGKTVLMVEHHMEVVTGLAQRIAVMHHGSLLAVDTPDAIMRNETVQQAYLGEAL